MFGTVLFAICLKKIAKKFLIQEGSGTGTDVEGTMG